ncbi:unnamed protein product [Litomosoides sigmodontis]|uniref:Uncharacterized protein n=1 Tax=Litomosoides sigmodontis TaxID=42156 RepID=A0A3P6T452_LITSI|nr:unnamed protein product [Litomosoides sigmodontis]
MLKNGKVDRSFKHHGNGWGALHWAARRNHQDIVELLLKAGFDPKSPAKNGKTPLDLTTNKAVKEILMQSVNIEANQEDSTSKEQPKTSAVTVTSDCWLTAQLSCSAIDIIIPCKILAEDKLQVATSQQNNDEIHSDKSVEMLISAVEKDCKSTESENEIGTESPVSPLLPEVDVNARVISGVTESNYFAPVRAECGVTRKDIPRRGKLQMVLLIGCVVGFGGLTYMLFKK